MQLPRWASHYQPKWSCRGEGLLAATFLRPTSGGLQLPKDSKWWGWRVDYLCWDGSVLSSKENDSSSNRTSSSETEWRRQLWMARERMLIEPERMGLLWSNQMDKAGSHTQRTDWSSLTASMATAGSDRKRKERKGGRREEGRVSLVSLKPKVRVEQGGSDGLFVLF